MAHRFFVDEPITSERAVLTGTEAHHLQHVMRGKVGDEVILFDGSGREFVAHITQLTRSHVELSVVESRQVDRELLRQIVMGVALPKADRQRWLIEKLVELGVTRIVPLRTQRSVVHPDERGSVKLRRGVMEATKQCGRTRLMEVADLMPLADYLRSPPPAAARWFADPTGVPWREVPGDETGCYLAVGPEGAWTEDELSLARDAGWHVVSLGERVLRIETACLVLATLLSQNATGPTTAT